MTEQTGQNSEVVPDRPSVQVDADAQSHVAGQSDVPPPATLQEAEKAGVPDADAPGSAAPEGIVEEVPAVEASAPEPVVEEVPAVEAAAPEPVVEETPVAETTTPEAAEEPATPAPAGQGKKRQRSESSKARKATAAPAPILSAGPKSENMNWYILKVQSNREESIREGLLRRIAIQGLDRFFGEVIVPTEKVTEFKGGKKRVIKRKLYPGYIVVHMEINEDTWFLVRETPGIGDFTGRQADWHSAWPEPGERGVSSGEEFAGISAVLTAMEPHEVERIIAKQEEKSEKAPDLKIPFAKGDRVKVVEGNFENFEGEVETIDKTNGRVTVMITIFNRTTPVEFEYWQVESV